MCLRRGREGEGEEEGERDKTNSDVGPSNGGPVVLNDVFRLPSFGGAFFVGESNSGLRHIGLEDIFLGDCSWCNSTLLGRHVLWHFSLKIALFVS